MIIFIIIIYNLARNTLQELPRVRDLVYVGICHMQSKRISRSSSSACKATLSDLWKEEAAVQTKVTMFLFTVFKNIT
jgi:hypothetical protein